MTRAVHHLAISQYRNPQQHGVPSFHAVRLFALATGSPPRARHTSNPPRPLPHGIASVGACTRPRWKNTSGSSPNGTGCWSVWQLPCRSPSRGWCAPPQKTTARKSQRIHWPMPAARRPQASRASRPDRQLRAAGPTLGSAVHCALELFDLAAPNRVGGQSCRGLRRARRAPPRR